MRTPECRLRPREFQTWMAPDDNADLAIAISATLSRLRHKRQDVVLLKN
jgi:hypothetical protein